MSDTNQTNEQNIAIENILPAIPDSERLQAKKEAEQTLYEVFSKYSK